MKRISESWKPYFLVFSVLLLVLTVVGDKYRSPFKPANHDPDSSHNHGRSHDHDESPKSSKTLDEAFSQAPDPGAIPVDPMGPTDGGNHVIRGASWRSASITELRLAFRDEGLDGADDLSWRVVRYAQ